jgi:hypothetical protein
VSVALSPRYKMTDIAASLRQVANQIEHGELEAEHCILILETADGAAEYRAFGSEPFTRAHAIGLCFAIAKEIAP